MSVVHIIEGFFKRKCDDFFGTQESVHHRKVPVRRGLTVFI